MSDEERRREERLAAIGEPSRRRQVELGRLVSALGAVLRATLPAARLITDPINRGPISVGAALYIQKLLREAPPLTGSIVLPLSTVVPLRARPDPNERQRLVDSFDRRVREGQIILPPRIRRRDP